MALDDGDAFRARRARRASAGTDCGVVTHSFCDLSGLILCTGFAIFIEARHLAQLRRSRSGKGLVMSTLIIITASSFVTLERREQTLSS